jgi:hypothetical protein
MEIVLNEWLLHYSRYDAEKEKKELVYRFITCIKKKDVKIIINWECPFIKKFQHFWDASKHDQISYALFKTLYYMMLNSEKVKYTEFDGTHAIPKEIVGLCPDDDLYLIQLAYNSQERIIITKDIRIIEKFKERSEIKFLTPEDFLERFCDS